MYSVSVSVSVSRKCVTSVRVCAHVYVFDLSYNGLMSFCYISYIYIYTSYIYICMLSSIVKEATTFEMELHGHKQATAHSHEHTKNSNPSKNNSRNDKFEFESAN